MKPLSKALRGFKAFPLLRLKVIWVCIWVLHCRRQMQAACMVVTDVAEDMKTKEDAFFQTKLCVLLLKASVSWGVYF